ncbi:hypothetical protein Tco_1168140, partial [Tanacetum coccineum]
MYPSIVVYMTADDNVSAIGQQHTEQPEFNKEGKVDQNAKQCHDIHPLPAKLTDDKTIELADQSLESENVCLKKIVAQTKNQNDSVMEQLNKKSNENADFANPSILGKPVGQALKNQSVARQPTAFKSKRPRISKPQFASQVDVNNDLSKPVTTHHLPKGRKSAPAKPHHMIALKRHCPRSCLRWQPMGRILKTVCLRWVPTGKIFAFSTSKVDSEPTHGSIVDIPHMQA